MRDFNKIPAKFWMTTLSKQLKQSGPEIMLLSIYLQTNHHTHSLGIFYLPISYIAHDIGISLKKVKSLIHVLIDLNFCSYDFVKEYIWLKGYALEQAGGVLKLGDNRVTQLQKYFEELPSLEFTEEFYQAHKDDFHLTEKSHEPKFNNIDEDNPAAIPTPSEAPSDTLRSTETETKTETKTESETETKTKHSVANTRPVVELKPVHKIFEHWKLTMNHPKSKLDNQRRRFILKALGLGYDCEQLCQAITGCANTPHNMGVNDRGQRYDGLHVILRDADQIDRFIRNHHEPPKQLSKTLQASKATYNSLQDWIEGTEEQTYGEL